MKHSNKTDITIGDIGTAPDVLKKAEGSAELASSLQIMRARDEEIVSLKDENRQLKAQNATSEILGSLIKPYARSAYQFMVIYCGVVALLVVSSGFGMVLTGIFIGARKK